MSRLKISSTILAACAALLAAGCSSSPRTSFYTLTATAVGTVPPAGQKLPSISIGAVTLPEFVDRPQLVLMSADNRLDIIEQHQWAESLKNAIPRTLADNLSRQLGTDMVSAYPQQIVNDADYRLAVDFQHFDASADSVSIDALWTLRFTENRSVAGRSRVLEARKGGYDTIAAAYSRALATVSTDIARAVRQELRP